MQNQLKHASGRSLALIYDEVNVIMNAGHCVMDENVDISLEICVKSV